MNILNSNCELNEFMNLSIARDNFVQIQWTLGCRTINVRKSRGVRETKFRLYFKRCYTRVLQ